MQVRRKPESRILLNKPKATSVTRGCPEETIGHYEGTFWEDTNIDF